MNEKQATLEGLVFVGTTASKWNTQELEAIKQEAQEIKKLGFRAVVVQSGINEWGGGSKVLYAERNYTNYRRAQEYSHIIENSNLSRKAIIDRHLAELAEFDKEVARKQAYIAEVEKNLGKEVK